MTRGEGEGGAGAGAGAEAAAEEEEVEGIQARALDLVESAVALIADSCAS